MVVRNGKKSVLQAPFSLYRMIYWQKQLRRLKGKGVEDLPTSPDPWSYEEVTKKWGARAEREKRGTGNRATEAMEIVEEANDKNEDATITANSQSATSVARDSSANPTRGRKPSCLPSTTHPEAARCSQTPTRPQTRSQSTSIKTSTDIAKASSPQVSRPAKRKQSASLSATVNAADGDKLGRMAIETPAVTDEHAYSSAARQVKRKRIQPPSPVPGLFGSNQVDLSKEELRSRLFVEKSPPRGSRITEMAVPRLNDKSEDHCTLRLDYSDAYSTYRNW